MVLKVIVMLGKKFKSYLCNKPAKTEQKQKKTKDGNKIHFRQALSQQYNFIIFFSRRAYNSFV